MELSIPQKSANAMSEPLPFPAESQLLNIYQRTTALGALACTSARAAGVPFHLFPGRGDTLTSHSIWALSQDEEVSQKTVPCCAPSLWTEVYRRTHLSFGFTPASCAQSSCQSPLTPGTAGLATQGPRCPGQQFISFGLFSALQCL